MFPLFDSMACELELHQDLSWPCSDKGLTGFETEKKDTIWLRNYRDYYDKCGCFILDTIPEVSSDRFIAVSKFIPAKTPEQLISDLEKKLEFKSTSGKYSIEALQFCAYCPSGECQYPWQARSESPLNEKMKEHIRNYYTKDTYLELYAIIAKDGKGNYVRIHPGICWQYKL